MTKSNFGRVNFHESVKNVFARKISHVLFEQDMMPVAKDFNADTEQKLAGLIADIQSHGSAEDIQGILHYYEVDKHIQHLVRQFQDYSEEIASDLDEFLDVFLKNKLAANTAFENIRHGFYKKLTGDSVYAISIALLIMLKREKDEDISGLFEKAADYLNTPIYRRNPIINPVKKLFYLATDELWNEIITAHENGEFKSQLNEFSKNIKGSNLVKILAQFISRGEARVIALLMLTAAKNFTVNQYRRLTDTFKLAQESLAEQSAYLTKLLYNSGGNVSTRSIFYEVEFGDQEAHTFEDAIKDISTSISAHMDPIVAETGYVIHNMLENLSLNEFKRIPHTLSEVSRPSV